MLRALVVLLLGACDAANQAVWLTSIQPFTGADWDAGISMRLGAQILLEEVNANPSLLPGYDLKVVWQDGLCSKGVGTQLFLQNLFHQKYTAFAPGKTLAQLDADGDGTVTTADTAPMSEQWNSTHVSPRPVGLLGSGCAGTALNIANIGYMARFPMVSNSATRPGLSDRSAYPNFFRTIMPDTFFNDAWLRMARELNQTGVGVVIGEVENWGSMGTTLANAALAQGVQLIGNDLTQDMANFYGMKVALDSQAMAAAAAADLLRYKPRVIILLMFHKRNRLVLCEAFKLDFFNAVYMPMGWLPFGWWSRADTDCAPADMTSMALGFISANMMFWRSDINTRLSCSSSMTAKQFQDEWFRRQGGTHGDLSMRPEGYAPATEAATTADAVCMYAQMLHEVLINRGVPLSDLTERTVNGYSNIFDVLSSTDFEGVQGRVRFEPGKADPLGSVILQQLQYDSGGSLALLDVASYKHPVITFLGQGTLRFQFPGESFVAGPNGATFIDAHITTFRVCVNKVLDMRTNMCTDCPNNTQYVQRSGACLCVAGFYKGGSGCSPCPAGTISTAPGTIQCASCQVGKYAPPGATSCTFCPQGRFSNSVGLGQCHSCPPLQTTPDIASESVAACVCATGAHRSLNGSSCVGCPQSALTSGLDSPNISSCLCPKNTYMESSACKACPANSATNGRGKTSIDECLCERDTYLHGGICQPCPQGSRTVAHGKMSVRSCLCSEGTYMPSDARRCLACPKGMVCPKGSSENNEEYISVVNKTEEQMYLQLDARFWSSRSAPMSVFECRSKEKCPGNRFPGDACADYLRKEQACEHCQVGYHWTGTECGKCNSIETTRLLFPVLPTIIAPMIIIGMYKMFGDTYQKWSSWRNGLASVGFILLNFYQTIDIIRSINIQLPSVSFDMFAAWAFTNNMAAIFKLDCVGMSDFKASIVMKGLVPPIMAGYCVMTFCLSWLLAKYLRRPSLGMQRDRLLNVFGSLMFTFFNTIAAFCLLLYQCSRNPNGTQSLGIDLGIICFSSPDWRSMIAAAAMFVIFYIVGMGGLFVRTVVVAPKYFGSPGFQMRWKFLFIKFRADAYWWGLVFLVKNFLVNLSFVVTASGIAQLYLTMAVTTFYMLFLILITPFRHRVANALDITASLCVLYVSALLTWYADRSEPSIFKSVDLTSGLISLVPACTALGCVAYMYRYGYNSPPSERELAQAEKEFQELVQTFGDLCHLSIEEGAMVILEIGEWDRLHLKHAITALKTEALGHHTSVRVANKALAERVTSRVNSIKLTKSMSTISSNCSASKKVEEDKETELQDVTIEEEDELQSMNSEFAGIHAVDGDDTMFRI